jgi:DNA-binding transcriptional LysR family regulator
MLDLRRLRLLRELDERGTIAAVADALQFTPSAVSQQLAVLEREAGVPLFERAGRGVRLTDAALVLVRHATDLLDRAEVAEAELAASAHSVVGRGRVATFQSGALRLALPAIAALARESPGLRCELVEAEPEQALPELARGGVDLVLADEWPHLPHARPPNVDRHVLLRDTVRLVLPAGHPLAGSDPEAVPLSALARATWTTGHGGTPWGGMVENACRQHGGFDPDVRYRTNDAVVTLALVAAGLAVTLLPDLVEPGARPDVVARAIVGDPVTRTVYAATRHTDARRPSVQALLAAVDAAAQAAGGVAPAVAP